MEETQAGGIEFEVTYPVAPSYAPFRQKSLGDCTRPLLMGANEGPAWRLMSTFFFFFPLEGRVCGRRLAFDSVRTIKRHYHRLRRRRHIQTPKGVRVVG